MLGGSVFVGRRLVEALAAGGHDVAVLNRGQTATDLPDGVQRLVADRTDPASMRAVLGGTEWDVVYDVSGFVMVAGGSDIAGLIGLLDGRVGHYVFVSSIMAYDQRLSGVVPWTEDMPTEVDAGIDGGYGGFKAMAERAMLERHAATGFPASVVRPAAIYGPANNIFDMETPMFLRLVQHRPILLPHGGLVTVSTPAGAITLPLHVTDMPDRVVWLPLNSPGSSVHATLRASDVALGGSAGSKGRSRPSQLTNVPAFSVTGATGKTTSARSVTTVRRISRLTTNGAASIAAMAAAGSGRSSTSTPPGVMVSLSASLIPSARLCRAPHGPTRLGPGRSCIQPRILRSSRIATSTFSMRNAKIARALPSTNHQVSCPNAVNAVMSQLRS